MNQDEHPSEENIKERILEAIRKNQPFLLPLSLTTLNIFNNNIGENGAAQIANSLQNNSNLTILNISLNNIGDNGASQIANSLQHNSTLITLNFRSNNIGDNGASQIANSLQHNSTLTTLNLGDNSIGENGVLSITNSLQHNSTLTTLFLGGNNIGDNGASQMANSLQHNSTLTTLNLTFNNIGENGASQVVNSLQHNSTLTSLNLASNNIGENGASQIANSLQHNSTLTTLNLRTNNIGDNGASQIANSLQHNSTLTNLYLGRNNIGDNGASQIANSLQHNSTLIFLDLEGNKIGDELLKKITLSLKRNQENKKNVQAKPAPALQPSPTPQQKPSLTVQTSPNLQPAVNLRCFDNLESNAHVPLSPFILLDSSSESPVPFKDAILCVYEGVSISVYLNSFMAYGEEIFEKLVQKGTTIILPECLAVYFYTLEWPQKELNIYSRLNKCLVSENREGARPWRFFLHYLFGALRKIPKWECRQDLYRGVACNLVQDYPDKYILDKKVIWYSCTSTTTNLAKILTFLPPNKPRTIFIINGVFSGRSIQNFSSLPNEDEILIPPGSRFQIVSVAPLDPNTTMIQMKQVASIEKELNLE